MRAGTALPLTMEKNEFVCKAFPTLCCAGGSVPLSCLWMNRQRQLYFIKGTKAVYCRRSALPSRFQPGEIMQGLRLYRPPQAESFKRPEKAGCCGQLETKKGGAAIFNLCIAGILERREYTGLGFEDTQPAIIEKGQWERERLQAV